MALPTSATLLKSTSEVTLVAPTNDMITYTLTNDNPTNTTLVDLSSSDRKVDYTVSTEFSGSKTQTRVKNVWGEAIAILEWRETLSDKLTIGNNPPKALNKWLKSGMLPLSPVSFQDHQRRKYQWKNVAAGLDMQLYAADTPGGPIAAFCKSRIDPVKKVPIPATFTMNARAREIADMCVMSFLFLEKKRRMRENVSLNRVKAMAEPGASLNLR
ncbi:hypothetical protein K439DRAFT_1639308 [Ramaria rubella]|nr:hypothetical protein K439DRAFT_1639308 [Ramaria rubella]